MDMTRCFQKIPADCITARIRKVPFVQPPGLSRKCVLTVYIRAPAPSSSLFIRTNSKLRQQAYAIIQTRHQASSNLQDHQTGSSFRSLSCPTHHVFLRSSTIQRFQLPFPPAGRLRRPPLGGAQGQLPSLFFRSRFPAEVRRARGEGII